MRQSTVSARASLLCRASAVPLSLGGSPGAIWDPNNPPGGYNSSGPLVDLDTGINSTWQFNVGGMVQLPLGINTAANLYGRQGFPMIYFVDVNPNDGRTAPSIQIGPVTAYRLPNVILLDLHVERPFQIGSLITVSPELDCFNVANSHPVLSRDGRVGTYDLEANPVFQQNGNFNAAQSFVSSRVVRGGVRIAF